MPYNPIQFSAIGVTCNTQVIQCLVVACRSGGRVAVTEALRRHGQKRESLLLWQDCSGCQLNPIAPGFRRASTPATTTRVSLRAVRQAKVLVNEGLAIAFVLDVLN